METTQKAIYHRTGRWRDRGTIGVRNRVLNDRKIGTGRFAVAMFVTRSGREKEKKKNQKTINEWSTNEPIDCPRALGAGRLPNSEASKSDAYYSRLFPRCT